MDDDCASLISRLQHSLAAMVEGGDYNPELLDFLTPFSEDEPTAFRVLTHIHSFLNTADDGLCFVLSKLVAKFACASERCSHIARRILDHFVATSSPLEMLSVLSEALTSPNEMLDRPGYFAPLLATLAKVIMLIQRRQFEHLKAAIPVVLGVLRSMSLGADEERKETEDLFHEAIALAVSMQAVCKKLDQTDKKKVCALLGMFILQVLALASIAMGHNMSTLLPIVLYLSRFLPFCGFSYEGLITGLDVDNLTAICGVDWDDIGSCFSHVKHGASLAVIWGYKSIDASVAADADFQALKHELQMNQTKRWQAIGMLRHVFLSVDLSCDLKTDAMDFLLCIMDGCEPQELQNDSIDYYTYVPTLYMALQAIEMVIIYAPTSTLRKKSFDGLKKVLADVPSSIRFDILKALIQNSESSSMIAILFDCVQREMHEEHNRSILVTSGVSDALIPHSSLWSSGALELVEVVLKPPNGGPPSLPEYSEAVLSALNLYRFMLITESTGNTSYTGVLSKDMLQKAYNEWLLPLRMLVMGIVAESQKDHDSLASDTICALNPVEGVLYRCIELLEDHLRRS